MTKKTTEEMLEFYKRKKRAFEKVTPWSDENIRAKLTEPEKIENYDRNRKLMKDSIEEGIAYYSQAREV